MKKIILSLILFMCHMLCNAEPISSIRVDDLPIDMLILFLTNPAFNISKAEDSDDLIISGPESQIQELEEIFLEMEEKVLPILRVYPLQYADPVPQVHDNNR